MGPKVFDLWVYYPQKGEPRYLLLHTSQEKADKWFGSGRFWQIPGDFIKPHESMIEGIRRHLDSLGLKARSVWACEYVYTIYNRRFDSIQIIPVFAAEVSSPKDIPLSWEHSEFGWFTAAECMRRINFEGLKEGLRYTRRYVTEAKTRPKELKILWSRKSAKGGLHA